MNKLRWTWLAVGWFWVAAIFYLSLMPHPPEPVHFWNADKLEHALAYCLLMLWFCQVYRQRRPRLMLAMLLVAMGVLIEYMQRETGYRFFDYADMLSNATGVLVGWAWARTGLGRVFAYLEYHAARKSRQP
ncbi:MAG TPA: VanZ family protein [Gallionellaceae bacterium]|nr:VanZ family protein [Gallionellaceae bacterium]